MSPPKEVTDVVIQTVRNCPACGCTHVGLYFRRMLRTTPSGATHGANCPVNDKPLFTKPHLIELPGK
jgi:hypothetical protein